MGFNTKKFKPLQDRINIVITSTPNKFKEEEINNNNLFFCSGLDNAKDLVKYIKHSNKENIFIIGGESIYKDALENHTCSKIYYTEVYQKYDCDTFFPTINKEFKLQSVSKFIKDGENYYRNLVYINTNLTNDDITLWENKEEKTYLQVMNNIISLGEVKVDRTEVGISLFSEKHLNMISQIHFLF